MEHGKAQASTSIATKQARQDTRHTTSNTTNHSTGNGQHSKTQDTQQVTRKSEAWGNQTRVTNITG